MEGLVLVGVIRWFTSTWTMCKTVCSVQKGQIVFYFKDTGEMLRRICNLVFEERYLTFLSTSQFTFTVEQTTCILLKLNYQCTSQFTNVPVSLPMYQSVYLCTSQSTYVPVSLHMYQSVGDEYICILNTSFRPSRNNRNGSPNYIVFRISEYQS